MGLATTGIAGSPGKVHALFSTELKVFLKDPDSVKIDG